MRWRPLRSPHLLSLEPARFHIHEQLLALRSEAKVVGRCVQASLLFGLCLRRNLCPFASLSHHLGLLALGFEVLFAQPLLENQDLPLAQRGEVGPRHLLHSCGVGVEKEPEWRKPEWTSSVSVCPFLREKWKGGGKKSPCATRVV